MANQPRPLAKADYMTPATLTEMNSKRINPPGTNGAPKFSGEPEDIKDFFVALTMIYATTGLTDQGAKVELAVSFINEDIREVWQNLPAYAAGNWEEFKKEVIALYNRGPTDIKYSEKSVIESLKHYEKRKITSKRRWLEVYRTILTRIQSLIDTSEITEKKAVDLLKKIIEAGAWSGIMADMRTQPIRPNGQLPQWAYKTYLETISKYFTLMSDEEDAEISSGSWAAPISSTIKSEMSENTQTLNGLRDAMVAMEKTRQAEAKAFAESHQKETRSLLTVIEKLGLNIQASQQVAQPKQITYEAVPQTPFYPMDYLQQMLQAAAGPSTGQPPRPNLPTGGQPPRLGGYNPQPSAPRFMSLRDACLFCGILGHFIKDCPIRMLLESSGEIYKPAGTRNYCFRNGTPLHQRDSEGRNPFEQVKKLQQESPRPAQAAAPAPAPRIQNYTSQEDEWFAPSRTQEPVGLIPLEDDQETQSGFQKTQEKNIPSTRSLPPGLKNTNRRLAEPEAPLPKKILPRRQVTVEVPKPPKNVRFVPAPVPAREETPLDDEEPLGPQAEAEVEAVLREAEEPEEEESEGPQEQRDQPQVAEKAEVGEALAAEKTKEAPAREQTDEEDSGEESGRNEEKATYRRIRKQRLEIPLEVVAAHGTLSHQQNMATGFAGHVKS
ncbi:hypothetical protein BDZ89DRAFT_1044808 [Hymenopellis radicata]|nr:hypothetical protein BDZ89DRAFT_1044808 [Hymenopellis radicata]